MKIVTAMKVEGSQIDDVSKPWLLAETDQAASINTEVMKRQRFPIQSTVIHMRSTQIWTHGQGRFQLNSSTHVPCPDLGYILIPVKGQTGRPASTSYNSAAVKRKEINKPTSFWPTQTKYNRPRIASWEIFKKFDIASPPMCYVLYTLSPDRGHNCQPKFPPQSRSCVFPSIQIDFYQPKINTFPNTSTKR